MSILSKKCDIADPPILSLLLQALGLVHIAAYQLHQLPLRYLLLSSLLQSQLQTISEHVGGLYLLSGVGLAFRSVYVGVDVVGDPYLYCLFVVPQGWLGLAPFGVYIAVMFFFGTFGIVWHVLRDMRPAFILRLLEAFSFLHEILDS